MLEAEFNDVKDCQRDGQSSFATAAQRHIPLREVNIAYGSSDYEFYLSSRKEV